MKKSTSKLLNILIVALVIFDLLTYQFYPIFMAKADESPAESAQEDSSSEEEEEEEKEDIKEEETDDDKSDSEDEQDDSEEPAGEENKEEQDVEKTSDNNEEDTESPIVAEQNTEQDSEQDGVVSENPIALQNAGISDEEPLLDDSASDCSCENETSNNGCISPCDADEINSNAAQDVENVVAAKAVTGENEISDQIMDGQSEELAIDIPGDAAENNIETEGDGALTNEEENPNEEQENSGNNSSAGILSTDQAETPPPAADAATIATGDATAAAGAINEINTNILTDNGVETIENIDGEIYGDINLLDTFNNILEKAKDIDSENQDAFDHIVVTNINLAQNITNTVSADAETGNNIIENTEGTSDIITGSANAIASVVNLINTNITGNNWLLAIINVFGNWTGDLIVPGEGLLSGLGSGMQFGQVTNMNEAVDIENNISATADTGNNSIIDSGSAEIITGAASSSASGTNLINTNIIRNNWFFLMINNSGNWIGRVLNWSDGESPTGIYEYDFGTLGETIGYNGQIVDVFNYNSATNITNTAIASAETGGNSIEGSTNASISTGNASASASAFNFINTNITGNNWFFGVVNNAGTWNGNVVFAYPDLDVSLSADKDEIGPGETVGYTLKYKNIGQASCQNVDLAFSLPKHILYQSGDGNMSGDNNTFHWSVDRLEPGEERIMHIVAKLSQSIPYGTNMLEASAQAQTDTKEIVLSNNSASNDLNISFPAIENSQVTILDESAISKKESGLKIERKDDVSIRLNELANHYIKLNNSGKHTLYNLIVTEKIKTPDGKTAAEYNWMIAKLKKGQTAYIQYQIMLDNSAVVGTYRHSASAMGYDYYGNEIKSKKAEVGIELLPAPFASNNSIFADSETQPLMSPIPSSGMNLGQEVLGATTENIRETYLSWWLLLLILTPIAYYFQKNQLYSREKLLRLSRQISNFLSSFL